MTATCPVCKGGAQFSYSLNGYDLYDCSDKNCRHCFVHPLPTEEELFNVYNIDTSSIANSDGWTLVEDYKSNPHITHAYYQRTRLDWLQKVAGNILADKSSHILDIGCSTGMFLRTLKDFGYSNLHGFDISPSSATFVAETQGVPCSTNLADVPAGAFDLITCYAVLEHVGDPEAFIQLLSTKLKPNGKLALLVPNYASYYRKIVGKSWVWLIPPIHLQYFNSSSLRTTVDKAGLTSGELAIGYTSGTYLYLVMHHVMQWLGWKMPSTSRSRNSGSMALIEAAETLLRIMLWPARKLAQLNGQGNELLMISSKPVK